MTSPVFNLIVVNEEYDQTGSHSGRHVRAGPDTRWAITNVPVTFFPLTQPEADLKLTWDHKFLPAAIKCRFKSRHRPITSVLCKCIFGETFRLGNNSRVKDKRTRFSFTHRLQSQGLDPIFYHMTTIQSNASLQLKKKKKHNRSSSDHGHMMEGATEYRGRWLQEQLSRQPWTLLPTPEDPSRCHI